MSGKESEIDVEVHVAVLISDMCLYDMCSTSIVHVPCEFPVGLTELCASQWALQLDAFPPQCLNALNHNNRQKLEASMLDSQCYTTIEPSP